MIKIFTSLIFLCVSVSAWAQTLGDIAESGASNHNIKNSSTSRNSLQASASNKKISATELDSIKRNAESSDAEAQFALGAFYAKGENGFPKDGAKAIEWLEKSALQKNSSALAYLGYLYAEGKLVKRDMKKAVEYRELAAEYGDVVAKWTLGNAYLYGFLVPKNHPRALHWIALAAEGGYVEAMKKLVEIYTNLNKADELEKWNARLAQVRLIEADNGNVEAMFEVAEKYMSGKDGFPRHRARAVYWYKKAAENGEKNAMEKIAKMYARGRFLPQNTEKALEYFKKLADIDFSYCFKISSYYAEGIEGFPKDEKESLRWFARGAQKGDVTTKMYLVWKYWSVGEIQSAKELCVNLIAQVSETLKVMETDSQVAKSVRAETQRRILKILETVKAAINSNAKAPENWNAYCRSIQE